MLRPAVPLAVCLILLVPSAAWPAFKLDEAAPQAPPAAPSAQPRPPRPVRPPTPRQPRPAEAPSPERLPAEATPAPAPAPAESPPAAAPTAPTGGEGWAFDPRSRCRVWVGEMQPNESIAFAGRCPGGVANGEGELQRRAGEQVLALYQGNFTNGRLNGPAVRISLNGDRLEAPFVDGQANGQGVLLYRGLATDRYEGMFREDQPNGRGIRLWADGARYEGDWVNGTRTGLGQQLFASGARYAGGWRADRPHGRGTMQYANGNLYDGDWVNGRRSGQGTLRWYAPGRSGVYEGQWRDDQRNGFGRESFLPENGVYEGSYVNDRPQGRGIYILGGKERYEGEVIDGCLRTGWRAVPVGPATGACQ